MENESNKTGKYGMKNAENHHGNLEKCQYVCSK
jgi:hypothetical protein